MVSKLVQMPREGQVADVPVIDCAVPWGWVVGNGLGLGRPRNPRFCNVVAGPEVFEKDQYYFHPDHLGSSSYVTDVDGEIYQHLEYFPFGETWVEESSNTQRTPYLFTGKELDEETGLYYFGARYYDPRTSVWQSPDPIVVEYLTGEGSGKGVFTPRNLNLFGYSHNRPMMVKDPDGQEAYAITRDLNIDYASVGPGSHSYIVVTTTDPSAYPPAMQDMFIPMKNETGGSVAGVPAGETAYVLTLGGHQQGGNLVSITNEPADVTATRQLFSGETGNNEINFSAKVQGDQLTSVAGVGTVELDTQLFKNSNNFDDTALPYSARILNNLLGSLLYSDDSYNCHGWGVGLANVSGVANYPDEFFGYDPGINHVVPPEYYKEAPSTPAVE